MTSLVLPDSAKESAAALLAWAKENGIRGYEMYDPRNRENDRRKKIMKIVG